MFLPNASSNLQLVQCSAFDFVPKDRFDLVTFVHGLHYLGDKLRAIELAASWLVSDGRFVANLDVKNICLERAGKGQRRIARALRENGCWYLPARHLLRRDGWVDLKLPFRFIGADDTAGPNYTKQPAVDSYYELRESQTRL
jgi:SAM-dependent methyltransferase